MSLASEIFNMFTGGGSHARLPRQQGADLQDNASMSLCLFFMPCSMTTGPCSQHIVCYISYKCLIYRLTYYITFYIICIRKNVILLDKIWREYYARHNQENTLIYEYESDGICGTVECNFCDR